MRSLSIVCIYYEVHSVYMYGAGHQEPTPKKVSSLQLLSATTNAKLDSELTWNQ